MSFVPLHVHTTYGSILDSIIRVNDLVDKVKELGCPACAITDHGSMASTIGFYKRCKDKGVKPIIGCEVYVADDLTVKEGGSRYNHLILLAKNNKGYENLKTLSSIGYLEGFYAKPRVDFKTISKYSEGLICLSACLAGEVSEAIIKNTNPDGVVLKYKELFGDDYYLEIQSHCDDTQLAVNKEIVRLAKQHQIKVVSTTDAHFLNREDYEAHNIFININQDRDTENYKDCYIQNADEMIEKLTICVDIDIAKESLKNTIEVAEKCDVEIELGHPYLPHAKIVPPFKDDYEYLVHLVKVGLKEKGILKLPNRQEYIDRAKMELEVIKYKDFQGYFLKLREWLIAGKKRGIPFGECRGSSGGSIVAYLIGITNVDSVKYDLDFGRFLTKERTELCDIDTDVSTRRRTEFIKLITDDAGAENVAQIGTFNTLAAKSVIDSVGKVMGVTIPERNELKKNVSETDGVAGIKKINPKLYKQYKELIEMCIKLEGLPRSEGAHAGGVCVSGNNKPMTHYAPLRYNKYGNVTAQFEMKDIESVGLVKFDMLGLRTLDIIADALSFIGSDYYSYEFNYEDPKIYEMVSSGDTNSVFQAESNFMTQVFKEIKPKDMFEWSDCIAIGRPDSIKFLKPYVDAKFHGKRPKEIHPDLTKVLGRTYGCLIYQEQIMNITKVFAGFSDGEADKFRKIVSKKKLDLLPEQLGKFKARCVENGYTAELAEELAQLLSDNANYCFNMAHSISYAITGYKTAYLKYYHPVEFMASVLNNQQKDDGATDYESVSVHIKECERMGIKVMHPDLNKSIEKFKPIAKENTILYGFGLIKDVGSSSVEVIMKNRPFKNVSDFIKKCDVCDKATMIALIKSGSADSISKLGRADILKMLFSYRFDNGREDAKPIKSINKNHIRFLLDNGYITPEQTDDKPTCLEIFNRRRKSKSWDDFKDRYMLGTELDWEMETVNAFMSGDPFEGVDMPDWERINVGDEGWIGGTVRNVKKTKVKNGKNKGAPMAFINIDSIYGIMDCVVFTNVWLGYQDLLKFGKNVMVCGEKQSELNMVVSRVITLEEYKAIMRRSKKYA